MNHSTSESYVLALDGGGTATRAGLFDTQGSLLAEARGGASNPLIEGERACLEVVLDLYARLMNNQTAGPVTLAAGIAGCAREVVRERIAEQIVKRLTVDRVVVSSDVLPLVTANAPEQPALVVVAGTGSSILVHHPGQAPVLLGGRGPVFGDAGSAYSVAQAGLNAAGRAVDGVGPATVLVEALPAAAGCSALDALPLWTLEADRRSIANLARTIAAVAVDGDGVAMECLREQAEALADWAAAGWASLPAEPAPPVLLHGGMLNTSAPYRELFEAALRRRVPNAAITVPPFQGIHAVAKAARRWPLPDGYSIRTFCAPCAAVSHSPTESRLEHGPFLDRLDGAGIVALMNREDATLAGVIAREAPIIADVIARVAMALRQGGRLIYLGAGTSGRLGVLDASECPPTFGVAPDRVVGMIAGGDEALRHGIEGAEDDEPAAIADLGGLFPPVSPSDVVVGIAASGTTLYVRAGLTWAQEQGATVVLLCCNPACRDAFETVIALDTGPEVLAGSTRLKAGTATKMTLNMITTGAMALSGYVFDGLMVRVRPVNEKLRRRAAGIVAALTDATQEGAMDLLDRADGEIGVAVIAARCQTSMDEARRLYEAHGKRLRSVLDEQRPTEENQ